MCKHSPSLVASRVRARKAMNLSHLRQRHRAKPRTRLRGSRQRRRRAMRRADTIRKRLGWVLALRTVKAANPKGCAMPV